jgi:putative drug exporter of the RND superfamily
MTRLLILTVLLRALVLPLLLIATVILSFGAALGVSAVIFTHVFGYPGEPSTLPLLAFIFLVALGVDYNIVGVHMPAAAGTVAGRAMADAGR